MEAPQLSPQRIVNRYNGSNTTAIEGNRNVIVVCVAGSSFCLLRGAGRLCEASTNPLLKARTAQKVPVSCGTTSEPSLAEAECHQYLPPKETRPLPTGPTWPLLWLPQLNGQGASGPDSSCPANTGEGCFATTLAILYLPEGCAGSVGLRDAMCPSIGQSASPPSLCGRRAGAHGLSVLRSNSPATSTARFHDGIAVRREKFAEDTMPGKSLEKVYLEKIPFRARISPTGPMMTDLP